MKICPNCKAELEDNARFCLSCMTSLDKKEQITPPAQRFRRWPLVLLCLLLAVALAVIAIVMASSPKAGEVPAQTTSAAPSADPSLRSQTLDGVCYTFRPATLDDYPTALTLENRFVLTKVEGNPADGVYRVPTFVGSDTGALVVAVADGAFAGTEACAIDLGHAVRQVHANAFGGCALTDLHLHEDVLIPREAFSGCAEGFTIHCPDYLENTEGTLWSELATVYGFRWQPEVL